jgi:hypothetical protein
MDDIGDITLFHGSYRRIETFHPIRYVGAAGVYFTPSLEQAWEYARNACMDDGDAPTVMCVRIDVTNPVVLKGVASQEIPEVDVAAYREAGYDGAVGVDEDGVVYEYVAFGSEQVVIEEVLVGCLDDATAYAGP